MKVSRHYNYPKVFIKNLNEVGNLGRRNYMFKTYSMELAGRTLTVETGKMAGLANGSALIRYGETTVIVNVTASKKPREGIDFFRYQ